MIRTACESDLSEVAKLLDAAFEPSQYESSLVSNLVKNDKMFEHWVFVEEERVVGYMAYTLAYNGRSKAGFLWGVFLPLDSSVWAGRSRLSA